MATSGSPTTGSGCATWADHDWSAQVFLTAGCHPVLGRYEIFAIRCRLCGRQCEERQWTTPLRATLLSEEER